MFNYLEIIETRGRAEPSITRPFKCLAADRFEYFVKGKSLGVQDSIKEWLGGYLGKALGLPVPEFCAVSIVGFARQYSLRVSTVSLADRTIYLTKPVYLNSSCMNEFSFS